MEKSLSTLKLLLLMSILCHYSPGHVTSAEPEKGICASIAANKQVDFFLIGRKSSRRLLITAKPDYLVYDLPADSLHNDTLNISRVIPVPLSVYYPELFTNEHFKSIDAQSGKVFTFTQGTYANTNTYIKMISNDLKLLVTFNMDDKSEVLVTSDFIGPDVTQDFVSSSDNEIIKSAFYSFYVDSEKGPIRKHYDFDFTQDMSPVSVEITCKDKKDTMVLRLENKTCGSYQNWDWASSPKGWSELKDAISNHTFYLFEAKNQMVSIFEQDDIDEDGGDVISVVRHKAYKDFFVCPESPQNTPKIDFLN